MAYRLKDFGSYTAGGRAHHVTEGTPEVVRFTRMAETVRDPRGHFAVEHAYVQYFVPEDRRPGPPILLVHGGGMSGSCWDTTPDGRAGWLQQLLAQGFEVHVLDNAERGRAGFAPDLWHGDPILRSMEEAWSLFRIGPADGFATGTVYPGQLFPVTYFEAFASSFVPRWLTTSAIQTSALSAVLRRLGRSLVICHSQGGEVTFDALAQAHGCVAGIIALEPSGLPEDATAMAEIPCVVAAGDFLQMDHRWKERSEHWQAFVANLQTLGGNVRYLDPDTAFGPGNTHMLMSDKNSEDVLKKCISSLADMEPRTSL